VGGIATLNNTWADALSRHGSISHVLVISLNDQTNGEERISDTLSIRRVKGPVKLTSFLHVARELSHAKGYDILHSSNIFPAGFLMLMVGKFLLRIPTVITFHGTDILSKEGSFLTKFFKRFTVFHASLATTGSYSTRRLAAAHYRVSEERFHVVYYPVPPHKSRDIHIRIREGFAANEVLVLSVSNLVKRKGVDDLIRAIAKISDQNIKLLVVGDGPERDALKALVAELALDSRVKFFGRVPDVDLYYHIADIFSLASYYMVEDGDVEGLGIVLLEAQQHGLPVIGTKSGGIPEAILDQESGFVVPERDIAAIAEKIQILAQDPSLRTRMGEKGKAFIAEKFSPERSADIYVSLYESIRK
jgi:phosphatidylinositol alpha-1,6-mannosyltransferase